MHLVYVRTTEKTKTGVYTLQNTEYVKIIMIYVVRYCEDVDIFLLLLFLVVFLLQLFGGLLLLLILSSVF